MEAAGTHLPVLIHLVRYTSGPVLELGIGDNSTPVLHDLCKDRMLLSIDNNEEWVAKYARFNEGQHNVHAVSDWDDAYTAWNVQWDVVLIDHAPVERRIVDIEHLKNHAKFMVIHDTECPIYNYEPTLKQFKYRWDYKRLCPWTTVVSMTTPIPMELQDISG